MESVSSNFTATAGASIAEGLAISNVNFSASIAPISYSYSNGSATGSVNQVWTANRAIPTGQSETLNVFNFSGSNDGIGNALAMSRIKLLSIQNTTSGESNSITCGGAVTGGGTWNTPFGPTGTVKVVGGGHVTLGGITDAVYPVFGSSGSLFKVTNNGAVPATYSIAVFGATANGTNPP